MPSAEELTSAAKGKFTPAGHDYQLNRKKKKKEKKTSLAGLHSRQLKRRYMLGVGIRLQ